MTKFDELVKENLTKYNSEDEYIKENNIDLLDWKKWKEQGYSEDGTLQINDCYWLAGDISKGNYVTIDSIHEIADLLITKMKDSNFYELIEELNDDCEREDDKINENSLHDCFEFFVTYCQELAIFKQTKGKYKGHYCLVIDED